MISIREAGYDRTNAVCPPMVSSEVLVGTRSAGWTVAPSIRQDTPRFGKKEARFTATEMYLQKHIRPVTPYQRT